MAERLLLLRVYQRLGALSIVPTFLATVVGWVLFRADPLARAGLTCRAMASRG
ncbi:MAG: hypothetical protein WKG07_09350 [Hymenobacter sp.]